MGQFDWFGSIGATPEAVAVLNDQPILFTILLIVCSYGTSTLPP
jgi:hypothetical protein